MVHNYIGLFCLRLYTKCWRLGSFIELNDGNEFVAFAAMVLVVGLVAWQGVVGFVTLLSDDIAVVYATAQRSFDGWSVR